MMEYTEHCNVDLCKKIHKLLGFKFVCGAYWHNYCVLDNSFVRTQAPSGYCLDKTQYIWSSVNLTSNDIPNDAEEIPAYTLNTLGDLIRRSLTDDKDLIEFKESVMSENEVDDRAKILINILKRKQYD
jgi:hypothetical protein